MIDGWEIDAIYKYIILIGESFLVVLLAAIFFVLEHKTSFKKIKWIYRQIIIGVVFGGAAVFGTELGVTVGSSVANVRDAAPLVAGLIFGGPAGMIAATIGSVERILYSLVFHNYTGYFSMVACVIATFLSGIYAWALRKWFFEEKTPNWLFGFATAIIMEVIHFIILYLGHIKNPQEVLTIIKNIAVAMMLANGIGVALACLVVRLLEYGLNNKKHERHRGSINNKVQLGLLILILVTATMSTTFVFTIQNNAAYENAEYALTLNTTDVSQYIREYSNNIMLGAADTAAADYAYEPGGNEKLIEMKEGYGFTEVSLVALHDTDTHEAGEIIYSSNEDDIGFNLVGDDTDYTFYYVHEDVSEYGEAITVFNYIERYDEEIKVAAFTVPSDDEPEYYILVNMNEHDFYEYSNELFKINIQYITGHRRVFLNGYVVVLDDLGNIVSDPGDHINDEIGITIDDIKAQSTYTRYAGTIYEQKCYYLFSRCETYYVISVIPMSDVTDNRDMMIVIYGFMLAVIYASVFFASYILIKYIIIANIRKINETLSLIMAGDLEQKVKVNSSVEFMDLSRDINITVDVLKDYIHEAEERIDKELAFAKTIQSSSLPSVFPPFPEIKNFDIYATMNTAKEVGGDFYDFYLLDGDHIAFLVADVSGKGIPASMFMMESKALLKNSSATLKEVDQTFKRVNESLCQGNEANMFVTCWMGICDIRTGVVEFTNAGHNTPLIYRASTGKWEFINEARDLVLAGLDCTLYHKQTIKLEPGDKIYLYTDGVTEATNDDKKLYGENRLINYLNKVKSNDLYKLLSGIQKDIDKFVAGADQFDDITMLVFDFKQYK